MLVRNGNATLKHEFFRCSEITNEGKAHYIVFVMENISAIQILGHQEPSILEIFDSHYDISSFENEQLLTPHP